MFHIHQPPVYIGKRCNCYGACHCHCAPTCPTCHPPCCPCCGTRLPAPWYQPHVTWSTRTAIQALAG